MAYAFTSYENALASNRAKLYDAPAGSTTGGDLSPTPEPAPTAPQPVQPAVKTPAARPSSGLAPSSAAPAAAPAPAPTLSPTPQQQITGSATSTVQPLAEPTVPGSLAPTGAAPPKVYAKAGPSGTKPTIDITPYSGPTGGGPTGVLRRLREGLGKLPSVLGEETGKFTEAAGPYRTWEGIGGTSALEAALHPAKGAVENLEPARALVNAKYGGPSELDPDTVAALQEAAGELEARGQAAETSGGLQTLLEEETAGLSPGERAFEAAHILGSPGYRQEVMQSRGDVARLEAQLAGAQQEASGIGAQRAAEEAAIQKEARAELGGGRGGIQADLAQKVAAAKDVEDAVNAAWDKFQETGDPSDLAALKNVEGVLKDFNPLDFNTEARTKTQEGLAARQAILDKYPELKDIPLMELQITSRGHETTGWSPEDYKQLQATYDKPTLERLRKQAMQRQEDLKAAGFAGSHSTGGRYTNVVGAPADQRWAGAPQETKYGEYLPLYFGTDYEPPDVRSYVAADLGVSPTRENMATKDQREVYNRIEDLLDESDRLVEAGEPYRAAEITAEVGRYIDEEKAALQERRGQLSDAQTEWARAVGKAHERHEKASRFINKALDKTAKIAGKAPIVGKLGEKTVRGLGNLAIKTSTGIAEKTGATKIGTKVAKQTKRTAEQGKGTAESAAAPAVKGADYALDTSEAGSRPVLANNDVSITAQPGAARASRAPARDLTDDETLQLQRIAEELRRRDKEQGIQAVA